jgi:EAL domain-containing protein (putative c-di-GMP-specific phosphodiesterase class I)
MWDMDQTIVALKALRELGVRIAIDDFGKGYSSLAYLKRFPIDFLKIDRSFVQDVVLVPDDAAIVSSVISLAHGLNLTVVAEGVESSEQLEFLRGAGCDLAQGFFVRRPAPPEELHMLLQKKTQLQ